MTTNPFHLNFDDSYAQALPELVAASLAESAPAPQLIVLNETLAKTLGLSASALQTEQGIRFLTGNTEALAKQSYAMAYSGYQFGHLSPVLGDGRALLVAEHLTAQQQRYDLHTKGSGRTPFSRRGDGKAALAPMLREYIMGEAMHALGVPTTRALAVVATGDLIHRTGAEQGAVLMRVAASHIRVGTFQFAAMHTSPDTLRRLADYTIQRHYPALIGCDEPYLQLIQALVKRQAQLISQWVALGFVHGVMNTDNMTLSGETIDYGPCAFIDAYNPKAVFSSIDHSGRYAYGNQPAIAQWNVARFAETLLPLIADGAEQAIQLATQAVDDFATEYQEAWLNTLRPKLGLHSPEASDTELIETWLYLLEQQKVDYTQALRALAPAAQGNSEALLKLFRKPELIDSWLKQWQARLKHDALTVDAQVTAMNAVNPVYIPRNLLVEEALSAAVRGDLSVLERLMTVLKQPFTEREGFERYSVGAPAEFGDYITYCGT